MHSYMDGWMCIHVCVHHLWCIYSDIFPTLCIHTQAEAAALGGYDPKRGALLYQSAAAGAGQQHQQQQMGSSQELTAEGEPLDPEFLGAWV